ncbi:MAG: hypothetical protein IJ844_00905 [Prevotella sp.]|nr:hypothetical protein [Prevotella sp.]
MKRTYIKPKTEIFQAPWLLQSVEENFNTLSIRSGKNAGARGTDFMEDESEDNGMGYRRYNLWDRE